MGFKKKNKVSAEFSMSSLTDIIFLLLIFFMLTSNLVAPNALNLKLPGSSSSSSSAPSELTDVAIKTGGKIYLNRDPVKKSELERKLKNILKAKKGKMDMTITPNNSATKDVVFVMDIARRLNINAILATEAK